MISELKNEEQQLMKLLEENRNKQRELNKAAFIEKNGVGVGDTVEWGKGNNITRGIISEVECSGVNAQRYKAYLFNSDGKIGKREVRIWHFDFDTLKIIEKANK